MTIFDAIVSTESCFSNISTLDDLKQYYSDACLAFNCIPVEEKETMWSEFSSPEAFKKSKTLWNVVSLDVGNPDAPSKYNFHSVLICR